MWDTTKLQIFSIQMDGNTDVSNIEEEIFLCTYLGVSDSDGTFHVRNNFVRLAG